MSDEKIGLPEVRQVYTEFKILCGWSRVDIKEIDEVIRKDLATAEGAERDFDFPVDDRIVCWYNWLEERVEVMQIERGQV
jgi:hypothetical protein